MREEKSGKSPTQRKHVKGHQPLVYSLTLANTNRNGPWHKEELAQTLDTWGAQGVNVWVNRRDEGVRLHDGERSPTLTKHCGTGGGNVPMVGVRRLTPTECERLQGFEDGHTAGQADTHRYQQLGNAVCVNVAEWIGKRIMEVEG